MIDVSELITDPDFAAPYTVYRRTGEWVRGRFSVSEPQTMQYYGAVQPATTRELDQLEIGDNEHGVMKFFTRQPYDIYVTHDFTEDDTSIQISDEIEFRGLRYKVLQVMPWQHGGWTRAFASVSG